MLIIIYRASVFRIAYFVEFDSGKQIINALFDANLETDIITATLGQISMTGGTTYSDHIFNESTTQMVSFTALFGLPMSEEVSAVALNSIETKLQSIWNGKSGYENLQVTILTQEVYSLGKFK